MGSSDLSAVVRGRVIGARAGSGSRRGRDGPRGGADRWRRSGDRALPRRGRRGRPPRDRGGAAATRPPDEATATTGTGGGRRWHLVVHAQDDGSSDRDGCRRSCSGSVHGLDMLEHLACTLQRRRRGHRRLRGGRADRCATGPGRGRVRDSRSSEEAPPRAPLLPRRARRSPRAAARPAGRARARGRRGPAACAPQPRPRRARRPASPGGPFRLPARALRRRTRAARERAGDHGRSPCGARWRTRGRTRARAAAGAPRRLRRARPARPRFARRRRPAPRRRPGAAAGRPHGARARPRRDRAGLPRACTRPCAD